MVFKNWVCKNNVFGCVRIFNLLQGFNDCPNFSSKYGCWVRQSHGDYGVWWKNCSTSHSISIPWTICINRNVITVPVSYFHESCWYNDASVRSFFRCTKSSTIFRGLIHQCGEMKYEGVSKMSETQCWKQLKAAWYEGQKYVLHLASRQTISYIYYQTPRYVQDVLAMTLSWKHTAEIALHV